MFEQVPSFFFKVRGAICANNSNDKNTIISFIFDLNFSFLIHAHQGSHRLCTKLGRLGKLSDQPKKIKSNFAVKILTSIYSDFCQFSQFWLSSNLSPSFGSSSLSSTSSWLWWWWWCLSGWPVRPVCNSPTGRREDCWTEHLSWADTLQVWSIDHEQKDVMSTIMMMMRKVVIKKMIIIYCFQICSILIETNIAILYCCWQLIDPGWQKTVVLIIANNLITILVMMMMMVMMMLVVMMVMMMIWWWQWW